MKEATPLVNTFRNYYALHERVFHTIEFVMELLDDKPFPNYIKREMCIDAVEKLLMMKIEVFESSIDCMCEFAKFKKNKERKNSV